MKTTMEIPDPIFRKAKAKAAERGISFRQYVTHLLEKDLNGIGSARPWLKTIGGMRHLHKENVRIQKIIDEQFETIDAEAWE